MRSKPFQTILRLTLFAWGGLVLWIMGVIGWGWIQGNVLYLGDFSAPFNNAFKIGMTVVFAFIAVFLSMIVLYLRPHNARFPKHERQKMLPSPVLYRIHQKLSEADRLIAAHQPSSYRSAVILIDNLLDLVLTELGYTGSLGDKLKASGYRFSDLNTVWASHKYRNRLVHDLDLEPNKLDAELAISHLKRALRDLGVK